MLGMKKDSKRVTCLKPGSFGEARVRLKPKTLEQGAMGVPPTKGPQNWFSALLSLS
jgi:hypothetical protein